MKASQERRQTLGIPAPRATIPNMVKSVKLGLPKLRYPAPTIWMGSFDFLRELPHAKLLPCLFVPAT
jgi:hypothetical protein